jgi:hypothetical protein
MNKPDRMIRRTDARARVCLPRSFANSKVILEQVSETEIRIRKTKVIRESEVRFYEEFPIILSDRDRDIFFAALDRAPRANKALRRAMATYNRRYGKQFVDRTH